MAGNSFFTSSSSSVVGRLLSAIARNKIESIVLRYIIKNQTKCVSSNKQPIVPGSHGYASIKNNAIKDSFSHSFILSRVGLGEFAKLIRNRNTFEDLRDHHEFYQQPANLWSKETCLPTLSLYKVHVENFLKAIEKLLDKVFFFNRIISSST